MSVRSTRRGGCSTWRSLGLAIRLYLASALKSGAMAPGRGSLGEVLPESLKALFGRAATAFPQFRSVAWSGTSGRTFEFRLCPLQPDAAATLAASRVEAADRSNLIGGAAILPGPARISVSRWLEREEATASARERPSSDLLVGRLVHRLFQLGVPDDHRLHERAKGLAIPEEGVSAGQADSVVDTAIGAWRTMRARPDVVALLESGRPHYEVPFSLHDPESATILRGTIDCLVQRPDGAVTVVEFKTGARRPIHERQLSIYVRAAAALFPSSRVEGLLIYP